MNGDFNRNARPKHRGAGGSSLLLVALAIVFVLGTVYFAAGDREQSPLLTSSRDLVVPSPAIRGK